MAEALVSESALPDDAIAELAHIALGVIPSRLRAIAVSGPAPPSSFDAGPGWLVNWTAHQPYLLLAEPGPQAADLLPQFLEDRTAAVGPALLPPYAHLSLRWARTLLRVLPSGGSSKGGLVHVEDHLLTVILMQDQELAKLLISHRLDRLLRLTPVKQERIAQTLLAWFESDGVDSVAERLNVHPQTVRYRLRRAREIFGSGLRVSDQRLQLHLALKVLDFTGGP
ncbi:PucR family transcriptional regulator [Streptomyces sp. NPDC020800]|uniref:PucR family transcriptional regulator n=1 Tax=Streptomyces sp. NPDC020800 TaxID=3365092 RepID=UPI003787F33E